MATDLDMGLDGVDLSVVTLDILCERLRPIVLGGRDSCLSGTPMVPLHIATVTAIFQHLEEAKQAKREAAGGPE